MIEMTFHNVHDSIAFQNACEKLPIMVFRKTDRILECDKVLFTQSDVVDICRLVKECAGDVSLNVCFQEVWD